MNNTRIMEVKDDFDNNKKYTWKLEYNPIVKADELKEMTSYCKIAKTPDREYSFRITHNNKTYNYFSDGDDLLSIMAQMCILLDDEKLSILLKAQTEDWLQNKDIFEY